MRIVEAARDRERRRKLIFGLRALAGLTFLGILLSRADLTSLSEVATARAAEGVAITAGLIVLALVLSAIRWRLVLGANGGLMFLCRLYFIGWFFSLFLPTSVGGDAVRAVAVSRETNGIGSASASIVVERLLGIAALLAYFSLGAVLARPALSAFRGRLSWQVPWWQFMLMIVLFLTLLLATLALARRHRVIARVIGDAAALLQRFSSAPRHFTLAVLLSFLIQGTYILSWYELVLATNIDVPAISMLIFVPFVSLAAMLPVTLSGQGILEGAWVLLLHPFGVPLTTAIAFSLLFYVSSLVVGVVGGTIFVVRGTAYSGGGTFARTPRLNA